MNIRRGLLVLVLVALWSALTVMPAAAKDIPIFFTVEGNGFTTPVPFKPTFDPIILMSDVLNDHNRIKMTDDELADAPYYIVRGYALIQLEGMDKDESKLAESFISPLHYFPQEDGLGIIQYAGTDSHWKNGYFRSTAEIDAAFSGTIELAEWYHMRPEMADAVEAGGG